MPEIMHLKVKKKSSISSRLDIQADLKQGLAKIPKLLGFEKSEISLQMRSFLILPTSHVF
jgi:hypothetical protein